MVVMRAGVRCPLKPLALTVPSSTFKPKIKLLKPTCRNLFGANPSQSLRLASTLLESSASRFASRWNFDPIAEKPLLKGRYTWKAVQITPERPRFDSLSSNMNQIPKIESLPQPGSICRALESLSSVLTAERGIEAFRRIPSAHAGATAYQTAGRKEEKKETSQINQETQENITLNSCTFSPIITPLIDALKIQNCVKCEACERGSENILDCSCLEVSSRLSSSSEVSSCTKSEKRKLSQISELPAKKLKQTKITDYGRIMKSRRREDQKVSSIVRKPSHVRRLML